MDYLALLENSYAVTRAQAECATESRLAYLSQNIFNFITYDDELDELLARKAVEVCAALSDQTTLEYIRTQSDYEWYVVMCNMPFFADRIDWGTSIRGAWWKPEATEFQSCGLWDKGEQLYAPIAFTGDQWQAFVRAIVAFGNTQGAV